MVKGAGRGGFGTARVASLFSVVIAFAASAFGCGGSSTSHDGSQNHAGSSDRGGTSSGVGGSGALGGTSAVGGDASDQGGVGATGGIDATGGVTPTGGTSAGTGGTPPEPPIEECVQRAVQIPWVLEGEFISARDIDLELLSLSDAVVVVRRRAGNPAWLRSYGPDGTELGEAQLEEHARFLATPDGKLLVISKEDDSIYGRTWTSSLSFVEDEFSVPIVAESEILRRESAKPLDRREGLSASPL